MCMCVVMVCVFVCVHAHMWPESNNSRKGGQELERDWEQEGWQGLERRKGRVRILMPQGDR